MLTPEELRDIPEEVAEIFEECEDEILKLIAERINAAGYINTVSMWQLIKRKESLLMRREVARILARYTKRSEKEIRQIFRDAGAGSLLHDDEGLKANTLGRDRKSMRPLDRILKEAYEQTKGTFRNWTGTTASEASSTFTRAMDKAALQVQSGAFSYDEAIRRATRDLADHMDYVIYPSGHRDTLEVASRRAVRTGVNQMASKLTLERCRQTDTEFVETTAHSGARVTGNNDCTNHSWWQGRVFHLSTEGSAGANGKFYPGFYSYSQAGYGYGDGICGWNCRHSFHPFIPGVSEPVYTSEELEKLNEKVISYNGREYTRYEADQYQRGIERTIRKYKRRAILSEGTGDEKETERNNSYIRKWSKELDRFTKAAGLKRDYERERETVGRETANEPAKEKAPVQKAQESAVTAENAVKSSAPMNRAIHSSKPTQKPPKLRYNAKTGDLTQEEYLFQKQREKWYKDHFSDVTNEYDEIAQHNTGELSVDPKQLLGRIKDELQIRKILYEKYGGSIRCLNKDLYPGPSPDYIWNDRLWELKTPESGKNLHKLIEKGLLQINTSLIDLQAGGLIIDLSKIDIEINESLDITVRRIAMKSESSLDVIFIKNNTVLQIIRYQK